MAELTFSQHMKAPNRESLVFTAVAVSIGR